MGTRHMVGVVLDGEFRVAQYGQWDGYPSGQGATVLSFLRERENVEALRANVAGVRFATEEDKEAMQARWTELGADDSGWVTMDQSKAFYTDPRFAPLSRDVGADVLAMVAAGDVEFLTDSSYFAKDSLFCEWAYVVDLDNDVLECYKGFQKEAPVSGRWAGVQDGEYAAVDLAATFSLDALPTDQEFCSMLDPYEDEEDE